MHFAEHRDASCSGLAVISPVVQVVYLGLGTARMDWSVRLVALDQGWGCGAS